MEEIRQTMSGMMIEDDNTSSTSYDYLLNMSIWSLSYEKIEEINKEKVNLEEQIRILESKSKIELWNDDLEIFTQKYNQQLSSFIDTENQEYLKVT